MYFFFRKRNIPDLYFLVLKVFFFNNFTRQLVVFSTTIAHSTTYKSHEDFQFWTMRTYELFFFYVCDQVTFFCLMIFLYLYNMNSSQLLVSLPLRVLNVTEILEDCCAFQCIILQVSKVHSVLVRFDAFSTSNDCLNRMNKGTAPQPTGSWAWLWLWGLF